MCTGLDGNGDCADAIPPAADIATATAASRNQLPKNQLPKNHLLKDHLLKAPLPIFSLFLLSDASF
jgi:hypothetical protein